MIFVNQWLYNHFKTAGNAVWIFIFLFEAWASVRSLSIPLTLPISTGFRGIVEEIHRCQASDPKDKYFATLGLMKSQHFGKSSPRQRPNSSLEDVYDQLSRDIIESSRSLELLLYVTATSTLAKPTWVVDWQMASDKWVKSRWCLMGEGKFGTTAFVRSLLSFDWQGSLGERVGTVPSTQPYIGLDRDSKHLVVRGLVLSHEFDYVSIEFFPVTETASSNSIKQSVDTIKLAIEGVSKNLSDLFMIELCWFASLSQPFGSGPPPGHYFLLFVLRGISRKVRAVLSQLRGAVPSLPKRGRELDETCRGLWSVTADKDQTMSAVTARKVHEQVIGFLAKKDMRLVQFKFL